MLVLCHLFQALDTLGNTKWRINKRILSVVDRIWTGGGRLADLVDRDDVSGSMSIIFLTTTFDASISLIVLFLSRFPCLKNPILRMKHC